MADKPKILLHTCCAVCFEAVYGAIEEEGWDVTVFFCNPNIHPYREFQKRLRAAEVAAEAHKVPFMAEREYGLATWLLEVPFSGEGRCRECYRLRLEKTAETAFEGPFDAFTTTLLASEHQRHEDIAAAGAAAAERAGLEFLRRDWRSRMPQGREAAKRRSLYRQQYCGCIWSEYERFCPAEERGGE